MCCAFTAHSKSGASIRPLCATITEHGTQPTVTFPGVNVVFHSNSESPAQFLLLHLSEVRRSCKHKGGCHCYVNQVVKLDKFGITDGCQTSTLRQRKGRVLGVGGPGLGWGPARRKRRHVRDSIRPLRLTVALGLKSDKRTAYRGISSERRRVRPGLDCPDWNG